MRKGPKAHNTQAAARLERQRKSEQFANPSRFTERNVLSSPSRHSLVKGGSSTFEFIFQMTFFFSFTSSKREGISFPADGALEGSKRKAKQRVSPGSKNLEKNSKSARTNKSLRTLTRSRFRRDALSRLDRITIVESKSLSTHTRTQKERERAREGERSFVEFLAST